MRLWPLFLVFLFSLGCWDDTGVVVYTALDRQFSEPILKKFEQKTGIKVRAKYDTESTKTVGLTANIIEERNRPRCDVFWNNEIINTLRLQKRGLLAQYQSKATAKIPKIYRDKDGYWTGFAARARVLLVNTQKVAISQFPRSLFDLTEPIWKGKCGIARPIAGTTASHIACLYAYHGEKATEEFLYKLKKNKISIESGNKACARKVAEGELAMALTDTDDAMIEILEKKPVKIVYLDSEPGMMGTLFIPNTLALIKNSPHPQAAKKLIDFLLSEEVEIMLANSPSAQIPLNPDITIKNRVKTPKDIESMKVDFAKAALLWEKSRKFIIEKFLTK